MIFRIRTGKYRITFSIAPVTNVIGVNSTLQDGKHILMWDFDDIPLESIEFALIPPQVMFALPNIYIFSTGTPNHYIAYCFKRCEWREAVEIIASTPGVDWAYFKYGVYREKFTLRVTPKNSRKITYTTTLKSKIPEDCTVKDLKSFVKYETVDWTLKHIFKCPGCKHPLRHCILLGEKD